MDVALQQVRDQDSEKEKQAKHYADMRYHTKDRAIAVKDNVLLERKRESKLSPSYESQPYELTARYGDQVVPKSSQAQVEFAAYQTCRDVTCTRCRMQYTLRR